MEYLDLGNDLRTTAGPATLVEGPLGITARKIGTVVTWYTRMPDGSILNSRQGATTQNYFTEPHSKSVAALYSPSGTRTATYVYSPYGDTTVNPGGETGGAGDDNPFRYISGFQDTAGAEDYYKLGARYYDGHGHFTQPDPLAGSVADPGTMRDPSGYEDEIGVPPGYVVNKDSNLGDYCSYISDGPYANFKGPCARHDICVGDTGRSVPRSTCDTWFKEELGHNCRANYGRFNPDRYACYAVADYYYDAVSFRTRAG